MFEKSEWIWQNSFPRNDEYADFYCEFEFENTAILNISCDSNYAAFMDGELVAFGQYADFPHDKIYDSVDISNHCKEGKNRLDITVWYYGIETTAVYCKGSAALIFEITDKKGNILAKSGRDTLSRLSPYYKSHYEKSITPQLGYSFLYDATKNEVEYFESVTVLQSLPLRIRPNKKLVLVNVQKGEFVKKTEEGGYLFDIGKEAVGFISLDIESEQDALITIAYGEHIADGRVRRKIAMRDFSVEYFAKSGRNVYVNPFRRLGCRYLEVHCNAPIKINCIGILPTSYPLKENPAPALCGIHKEIYDICVNTLKLCMHEHYEDCPWREQGLYTMDSRNQMLCGYYAFSEYEFARSCLQLISKDRRKDGLLSICYPKSDGKVIPSFSLHYVCEVLEYYRYSNDISLLQEVFPKIKSVLKVFTDRLDGGLILPFPQENAWNFYEWRKGLDGKATKPYVRDIILSGLLSKALSEAQEIADILGIEADYKSAANEINEAINRVFFNKKLGLYVDFEGKDGASALGNSIAILCGAAKGKEKDICERLISDKALTPTSLSMLCFKYDALIKTDKKRYREYILNEIETVFTPMVRLGNGTVWETDLGESDFSNAGSLCHGWSAMPIYYYNILEV
ncbi:MAG: family 78 glycoside hydrolase catalytic domain [Clostridia bacterium]|nr:family 78 glycoside hydrolase catalytic domain [Clostridia bacterium]